ncbi:uncharacterized protein LOC127445130 isoform X2 [Myxocyprinus asiaticus]|uniref:uncharacterized protein LOC127445130 isoform X2 n=1 Tax=Myxocyprinus asiaticus TaxID=70543 RepID=UPI002221E366|nr:uncharacterized protein LOC127445130 isoform X2 [Myxocyprinus asiaticus]
MQAVMRTITSVRFSVPCSYPERYENNSKYFCWMNDFLAQRDSVDCVYTTRQDAWSGRGRIALLDNTTTHVLTAFIYSLILEDAGKYWFGVDVSLRPDFNSEFQLTITNGNPQIPNTQRNQEEHGETYSRFMMMVALMCVCALFCVGLFGLFQVLKHYSHNISVSAPNRTRAISDLKQDDRQRIKHPVLPDSPTADIAEGSAAGEFHRPISTDYTNTEAADMTVPDRDSYYIDVVPAQTDSSSLGQIYTELDVNRQSHVYQCLTDHLVLESFYHSIDGTDQN